MRGEKRYYVYIMASRSLTLYTGVTGDIFHRALQHRAGEIEGFTKKYHINRLVYYEEFKYVDKAIAREKQIKAWTRAKRLALIKSENATWQDLAEGWGEPIKLQIPHSVRDDKGVRVEAAPGSTDVSRENLDTINGSEKKESVGDQIVARPNASRSTA
ncbi:MAG: GIY-YIG nuclease family protein [Terriglobales bacterium]